MTKNVQSLISFFEKRSTTGWRAGGRERKVGSLTHEDVYKVLQSLSEDVGPIEDLVKFVKGHKKVARELTPEEVKEAVDFLSVKEIHNQ